MLKVFCATFCLSIYFITTIPCFLFLPLRSWMAGVPWSIHFPPPLFPNWFGSQWLPEPGAAPGLSWHHVIMSSCHMTCHHHLPQPSSQSRFQSDQCWPRPCEHLNKLSCPGKLLFKYFANMYIQYILFHAVMLNIFMAVGPLLSVICARGRVIDPVLFVWMSNKLYEP